MSPRTIRAVLQKRPFRPIEIHTASGTAYVVRHPEFAAGLGDELVVIYEPDGAVDWFEANAVCDIRRAGPSRNGRHARR